jgi:xanthine dehydrogenase accessory factor
MSQEEMAMTDWIDEAGALADAGERFVIVTVAGVRGSAPREVGARMIVTAYETIGTIGGGQLEYQCTQIACDMIRSRGERERHSRRFVLGSGLGQCCGGVVAVEFEYQEGAMQRWLDSCRRHHADGKPFVLASGIGGTKDRFVITEDQVVALGESPLCPADVVDMAKSLLVSGEPVGVGDYLLEPIGISAMNIALFGAGHVGAAVVDVLARIDCHIRWIDGRSNLLPERSLHNVSSVQSDDPVREVATMPAGSYYLVMTHSHPLDLDLCTAILERDDFAYCGLIGSLSKRRRFERMLRSEGVPGEQVERLTCPIGVSGVTGKMPADIALAVAAQLLQQRDTPLEVLANRDLRVPA